MNVLMNVSHSNFSQVLRIVSSFARHPLAGIICNINDVKLCSQEVNKDDSVTKVDVIPQKPISKAMKAYLERAQEHDEFMKKQRQEFQIGKRHLANMMGEDPETFSQQDIDDAIEYLFPSGLFDKRARPLMKPPEEVFPQRKAAEFDESGRPFNFLFYTCKPNYYNILHTIVQNINDLYKFEDVMVRKGLQPDPNLKLELSGYQWLTKENFEKKLVEIINDKEYDNFINAVERLSTMPYSYRVADFIKQYCTPLSQQLKTADVPKPLYDSDGRAYVTTYECLRKNARGDVTVRFPGTGLIAINGQDITYFHGKQEREQLLFPLTFTDMRNKVDVECNVAGGGYAGQCGALRWGIAMSLRSFVDPELLEQMRLAGLLTRDPRIRERMKPGQPGARKKYTWKKR